MYTYIYIYILGQDHAGAGEELLEGVLVDLALVADKWGQH